MSKISVFGVALLAVLMVAGTSFGQAVFKVDLDGDPASPVTQSVDAAEGSMVTSYVVVTGVTNMLGANADLQFDSSLVELMSISEQAGDINFDGIPALPDVLLEVSQFGLTSEDPNYISYYDRENVATPGIIALADILSVVSGFGADTEFWTNNLGEDLSPFDGFRESVEIFDPVAVSNTNGEVDDIVAVLLIRPAVRNDPGLLNQAAFDGDAVMAELVWRVVGSAGESAVLSFQDDVDESPVVLLVGDDPTNPTEVTGENSTINIVAQ